ncbi:sugar ABC transporter ATP-binding protein [Schaalia sp. lx-260]|uniref:sugar ABC transporter ATP-binding protein n=1 Tax=Schaalia sp. lx-260 TaxID=2899082 RepID=UPI001E31448B|nr:sugar ABC transporter ATP-binding protein [Schaalia sp. lx-260]MCD4548940.1 sugar ABC transporter ATP-binding protein [Schaalia sp. lx-260]
MNTSTSVLRAHQITKTFGGVTALRSVSLDIRAGEVMCLAGTNGCGKSTLIKILAGVEHPDSGEIHINKHTATYLQPLDAIHHGIQVIFQDMSVFPDLSVAENICFGQRVAQGEKRANPRSDRKKAKNILKRLGIVLDINAELKDLSVADRQIVAIARALNRDVRVLFMDEPTTALTHREVRTLFSIVDKLKQQGVAIVFVSHKTDEVLSISDRIVVMRNGEIVADAPRDQFTPHRLAEALLGYVTTEERDVTPICENAPEILTVTNLGARRLFKDINFCVRAGEIVGITGLLGSGRSEIAEAIVGKINLDHGQVSVDGMKVSFRSSSAALKAGIAYVPPDRLTQGVFLGQSIVHNIIASALPTVSGFLGWIHWEKAQNIVTHAIDTLAIKIGSSDDLVSTLSGGNQQKVVLGKCLSTHPKVLILNGPTVGVDIGAKAAIMQILRKKAQEGMAILLISDDLPELVSVCHRILVVRQGLLTHEISDSNITIDHIEEVLRA